MYLKRYHGETNTLLTVLLDASRSMAYSSQPVIEDRLRALPGGLAALSVASSARRRRVARFRREIRDYIRPSGRQGQLQRLLHAIEKAEPGKQTDFAKPFMHFQQFLSRRGIVVVISDFYDDPERIVGAMAPLRSRGNEMVLFHVLDPDEVRPRFAIPSFFAISKQTTSWRCRRTTPSTNTARKMEAHIDALRSKSQSAGIDYFLITTDRPLDTALREYLAIRQGRL